MAAERESSDLRKVTIVISDPDATDSSDDESVRRSQQLKRQKRVFHQIHVGQTGALTGGDPGSGPDPGSGSGRVKVSRVPGVRQRNKGRWCAEIRHPVSKRRVWLGTFRSEEEAYRAYVSKKSEFDRIRRSKQGTTTTKAQAKSRKISILPLGVHKTTGKYYSTITHPITKNTIFIGLFDTVHEASKACETKKLELDQRLQRVKENAKSKIKNPDPNPNPSPNPIIDDDFVETQIKEFVEKGNRKLLSILKELEKEEKDEEEIEESQESEVVFNNGSDSSSNCFREEEDEEDWCGEWVQMPDGREVKFSEKFGIPIVDNYGFLLGDFRRVDDDLWICSPEDDDDDDDSV